MTPEIGSNLWPLATTLWLCQNSYWKWPIYSGFTHWKWWFSIVMLVYQRVSPSPSSPSSPSPKSLSYARSRDDAEKDDANEGQQDWGLAPSAVTKPQLSMASWNSSWGSQLQSGHGPPTVLPRNPHMDWRGERHRMTISSYYPHNILQNTTSWAWIDKCDSKQKSEIALAHFCNQRHATSCNFMQPFNHWMAIRMATRGHPSWNALRHLKGYRWRPPRRWLLAAMPPKPTLMIALPWTWWVGASMARFCNIHVLVSLSISPFASIISWVLYIYIYHIDCRCIYCIYIYPIFLFHCDLFMLICWCVDMVPWVQASYSSATWVEGTGNVLNQFLPRKKKTHNSATGWWISPLCLWISLAPMLNTTSSVPQMSHAP